MRSGKGSSGASQPRPPRACHRHTYSRPDVTRTGKSGTCERLHSKARKEQAYKQQNMQLHSKQGAHNRDQHGTSIQAYRTCILYKQERLWAGCRLGGQLRAWLGGLGSVRAVVHMYIYVHAHVHVCTYAYACACACACMSDPTLKG